MHGAGIVSRRSLVYIVLGGVEKFVGFLCRIPLDFLTASENVTTGYNSVIS